MGFFGFFKKKNNSLNSFYEDCLEIFHNEANKYGVANKGVIFIPELIERGEQTILAFLNDSFFKMQFGDNAELYYYLIFALTVEAGMIYANKWYEDYSTLDEYVKKIISAGPADEANILLDKLFEKDISENQGNSFFQKIYPKWLECLSSYWNIADPRAYIMKAYLAAYQLGISMVLEKYGY